MYLKMASPPDERKDRSPKYKLVLDIFSPVVGFFVLRVPNSPTGQVLEAGPGWPVLVDADHWTRLTRVVRSGLDWSQTSLYKRSHESLNGTQPNTR